MPHRKFGWLTWLKSHRALVVVSGPLSSQANVFVAYTASAPNPFNTSYWKIGFWETNDVPFILLIPLTSRSFFPSFARALTLEFLLPKLLKRGVRFSICYVGNCSCGVAGRRAIIFPVEPGHLVSYSRCSNWFVGFPDAVEGSLVAPETVDGIARSSDKTPDAVALVLICSLVFIII